MSGMSYINEIRSTLLIIFNAGMVLRLIIILQSASDEEQEQSPKKRIKNHLIAAVIVNLSVSIVLSIASYYV